ncbi:Nucleoside diphosphate kinase [Trinorchestia longiramus]|nr:Nucleoside diphosphate kinase [Trinorchestia longiramus]
MERTFIAIKPDGVQRGIIGDIIKRFENKGFKLVAMKFMQASEDHLKQHYADLSDKPFFAGLVKYMASAPLLAMVWEGTNVVRTARNMMGETKPFDSKPGTIRGDFCIDVGRNVIHGSDSVESAQKEIALWFKPEEMVSWTQGNHSWIYESLERFGDLQSSCGLQTLNYYLATRSYVSGYTPSSGGGKAE